MTEYSMKCAARQVYQAINKACFNDALPYAKIIVEDKPGIMGLCAFDKGNLAKRLSEMEKCGKAKTAAMHVIVLTLDNMQDDSLKTLYSIAATLLHEAVHIEWNLNNPQEVLRAIACNYQTEGQLHGEQFQTAAQAHGLEVVTDGSGAYIDTILPCDTFMKILRAVDDLNALRDYMAG